ncbi:hypothetical protein Rsub_12593 [Raphidocelis subcapitata]|uniref:Fucosyltransferase n=1 Tax=Raphidocelis subcapitata TaxID=307507 RepID=A0A2V0PNF4_9CHLO|nr:hypothetical protein Rsub_12593 [Raphidocelis subcapitata]|eukprot:GBF98947.1 hypothetical protein Rsub_12593 [Raphidocelis subcapitata]
MRLRRSSPCCCSRWPPSSCSPASASAAAAAAAAPAAAAAAAAGAPAAAAAAGPAPAVLIASVNKHWLYRFDGSPDGQETVPFEREVPGCTLEGRPLPCRIVAADSEEAAVAAGAHATVWHAPSGCWVGRRPAGSSHLRIVAATESSVWYNCLDHPGFMSQFDAEMTYRMCSQVPLHFFVPMYSAALDSDHLLAPPAPFAEKLTAIAHVCSNCPWPGEFSGRTGIVKRVRALLEGGRSPVRFLSYGRCERNAQMPAGAKGDKRRLFRMHKFCFAMENSVAMDYVSEKLWDALLAGCVPVYLGAPNVRAFLPDPDAAIIYGEGRIQTPEDLVAELERLASDPAAYAAKLAWKSKTRLSDFPPGFQLLARRSEMFLPHVQCQLCAFVGAHARDPARRYTTCLWNTTWLERGFSADG